MNRRGDRLWAGATLAGFLILGATFFLRWKAGLSDLHYTIGIIVGAGLIGPQFITDMVAKYLTRGKGGSDAP